MKHIAEPELAFSRDSRAHEAGDPISDELLTLWNYFGPSLSWHFVFPSSCSAFAEPCVTRSRPRSTMSNKGTFKDTMRTFAEARLFATLMCLSHGCSIFIFHPSVRTIPGSLQRLALACSFDRCLQRTCSMISSWLSLTTSLGHESQSRLAFPFILLCEDTEERPVTLALGGEHVLLRA